MNSQNYMRKFLAEQERQNVMFEVVRNEMRTANINKNLHDQGRAEDVSLDTLAKYKQVRYSN
ncbi:hypothetical protein FACS189487_09040 [Campylobacterota bacterium]|nr:hypothetical protein FACS189487_09040 [Campylobacterota bacterium]